MFLTLDDKERELLLELLESAQREKLHELHHTATSSYKDLLRVRLESIERLRWKFRETEQPV